MNIRMTRSSRWCSRMLTPLALLAMVAAAGCGSSEDPFSKSTPADDAGTGTGTGNPPGTIPGSDAGTVPGADAGPGPGPGPTCAATPARYVVLGHSVAHCFAVGGVTSETCSLKNIHTYMATKFAGLKYENYAADGAVIADIKGQIAKIPSGPGHLFVNLFIGGNDLAAHLYESDTQAQKSWDTIKPTATANLEADLAAFDDKTKFPDGATILINSQYNPFDECVAGQYTFVTDVKQAIIKDFNAVLVQLSAAHANSVVVDQYTTFLGHGHNYNQSQCPKYIAGAAYWMSDLIHPNAAGHVNLSTEMKAAVDKLYACP
jgi:lysophospholipase L1-like esterase